MSRDVSPKASAAEIADELRIAITSGKYLPEEKIPGENILMSKYGVARMTARKALNILQSEGLTETKRGIGVFVRRSFKPIVRNSIKRVSRRQWGNGRDIWATDTEDRELVVDQITVRNDSEAPTEIATMLGLNDLETVTVRSRRFVLDGKPVMMATSYLPYAIVKGTRITQENTGDGGTYARLAEIGHSPMQFREDLTARMPTPSETETLEISPGTPVITATRTAIDYDGLSVEVNAMVLDASAYVVRYEFDAE